MELSFEHGFAFILEADTERVFYDALLHFFAQKHPECILTEAIDTDNFERFYTVCGPFGSHIVRMNSVGTITQIHNSLSWYRNKCTGSKGKSFPWTVFLCYDTDSYNADVTKFYEGDWKNFRQQLERGRTSEVLDLAANAEIEDIFLQDLHGISEFMGLNSDLQPSDIPSGRKGSARLKQLFITQRKLGMTNKSYHKGERARELIGCLDLQKIVDTSPIPLNLIEKIFSNEF